MATTKTRRKPNTALVFNPSRGLSMVESSKKPAARKTNPVRPAAPKAVVENPRKRKRRRNPAAGNYSLLQNPATGVGGLFAASLFAGGAITLVDLGLRRLAPQASPVVQIMLKGGLALAFQSPLGNKLPFGFAKYKNDIALVLGVMAAAQAISLWVIPQVTVFANQITGGVSNLLAPLNTPAATVPAGTMGYARRVY